MSKHKNRNQKGLTVIELMIVTIFLGIMVLALGIVLADSHRGWHTMYNRVYSDVVTEGHVARRTFDSVVRKASTDHISMDPAGAWVEVQYYQDSLSTELDRYARFYVIEGQLKVEHGNLDPGDVLSTTTICSNVTSCTFSRAGKSVQMVLKLDNGSETATVMSSAVAHN
jgi:Tfp pilus assembly protein PilV